MPMCGPTTNPRRTDMHDAAVTVASVLALIALIAMEVLGWLPG